MVPEMVQSGELPFFSGYCTAVSFLWVGSGNLDCCRIMGGSESAMAFLLVMARCNQMDGGKWVRTGHWAVDNGDCRRSIAADRLPHYDDSVAICTNGSHRQSMSCSFLRRLWMTHVSTALSATYLK